MKVLILGCGYIGQMVGSLLSTHHDVSVTTTSIEKATFLKKDFSNVFIVHSKELDKLEEILDEMDALVVCLAAKNKDSYEATYLDTAKNINLACRVRKKPLQIIYTSATSVYGDHGGKTVHEESPFHASSDAAYILSRAEDTYLSIQNKHVTVCIFRLSEIYGPNREISKRVRYYENKKAPGDGSQYANMIHASDIARAIEFALNKKLCGIYNLTDDEEISRKELYDKVAKKHGLKNVEFDKELHSTHLGNKLVSNKKIKKAGFKLKVPHRKLD